MPSSKQKRFKWRLRSRAWLIAGGYALISLLWIYFSDLLLFALFPDPETFARLSVYKGTGFVIVTALLLLLLLWRFFSALDGTFAALQESEKRLGASRAKLSAVINSAMDAIITVDVTGRLNSFNSAAEKMFLVDARKVLGRSVNRLLPAGIDHLSARRFETTAVRENGDIFPVEAAVSEVSSREGVFYTAILRDISERLAQQATLREMNESLERKVADRTHELQIAVARAQSADRLKSAFLATMSHELRTPLNSIIGFTGIVLQEMAGPLNDEQKKQLGMVRSSGRHLLDLINDVLDLSKIEAGELEIRREQFNLRESLERVFASVKPQADLKYLSMQLAMADDVGALMGDKRRVEQVVLNLLSNAIKFTDHGSVALSAVIANGHCNITVTDTGIGIREEDIVTLFQPFNQIDAGLTREHEGTGLGLAICRRLSALMGGSISVRSDWQQGSEFCFELPLDTEGKS
jgi:PAS domain S-box-containing protein